MAAMNVLTAIASKLRQDYIALLPEVSSTIHELMEGLYQTMGEGVVIVDRYFIRLQLVS